VPYVRTLIDQRDEEAPQAAPSTSLTPEQAEVRALSLGGDVDGLVSFIANQRLRGISLAETFDRVFAPALRDIGEGWARGRLNAAQEHIASGAVGDMLARIRPLVERSSRHERGRTLCACLGDERHDLGIRMAALVLVAEGYRVAMAGANVPPSDLAMLIAGNPPSIVALSASECVDGASLARDLETVLATSAPDRTHVIVGGAGFMALRALPANVARYATLEELVTKALHEPRSARANESLRSAGA
jgi:methanogenic corrinoid protein MtbC1